MPIKTPEHLWYAPHPGAGTLLARGLLSPFSALWWLGSNAHRALYRSGALNAFSPSDGVRVVAVGNVVAGGAGKTPVTLALMELCARHGIPAAVVGRGYGVAIARAGVCVSDHPDPATGGDEPVLLARAVPPVRVFAGPDRAGLITRAGREGARVVILDDAMQHHAVKPHALVAVVRAPQPFGNGRLLPAGPLREAPGALQRADVVVMLGADDDGESRRQVLDAGVREARLLHGVLTAVRPVALDGGQAPSLADLRGMKVVAAAGMARPQALAEGLTDLGAQVEALLPWEDHAALTQAHVEEALALCARHGATALVVTEKDAVKWPGGQAPVRVLALPVRVTWRTPGAEKMLLELLGGTAQGG